MALHLTKLAVGVADVDHLIALQRRRMEAAGLDFVPVRTRMVPRRIKAVLDGGSMYWVIKGAARVRQPVLDIVEHADGDGRYCLIHLAAEWHHTEARPRRAFQGWRYLDPADAAPDLPDDLTGDDAPPPSMAAELRDLGLL